MKVKCIIENCPSFISERTQKNKSSPTFHNVPRSNYQWIKVLGCSVTRPKSCLVICSIHFKDEDFVTTMGSNKILKKDAVPSKFLNLEIGK